MKEKKNPKPIQWLAGLLAVVTAAVWIWSRATVVAAPDGLIETAHEKLAFPNGETVDITIVGSVDAEDRRCLVWFMAEDGNRKYSYFPMEFRAVQGRGDRFRFVNVCPVEARGEGLAVCSWRGLPFLVNNEACKTVAVELEDGTVEEVEVRGRLPFFHWVGGCPVSCRFLDGAGNQIE